MVGVIPDKWCIEASIFNAQYEHNKVYLGRNRSLPQTVSISLEFKFGYEDELKEFFDFWIEETDSGAKPFYIKLPLYGERKHYLIALDGALSHKIRPSFSVTGKFILYRQRTLDENTAPILHSQTISVDMDSTNNFMHIEASDYDELSYEIVADAQDGIAVLRDSGVVYYTPNDGFSGTDTFLVRVSDELGATAEATMSVNVINWKLNKEFKLTMDENGHLYIDYVNPDMLDPLIVQSVDELSLGEINNNGEYMIDVSQTQHIDNVIKTANDEWLIITKIKEY